MHILVVKLIFSHSIHTFTLDIIFIMLYNKLNFLSMTEIVKLKAKKNITLIINPKAGAGAFGTEEKALGIVSLLTERGYDTNVKFTSSQGHAIELAKENAASSDIVVCCGGDGTLNETVQGIIASGEDTPIGYIPAGTTNDFAKTLKLPKDITEAVNIISAEQGVRLDVGETDNGKRFIYVASFGIFTHVTYTTSQNTKNKLGYMAYILDGIRSLSEIKSHRAKITADGVVYEGEYIFGAITNSLSIGGVMNFKPSDVVLNDGKFELLLIKMPKTLTQLGNIAVNLINQKYSSNEVVFVHASEIITEFEQPTPLTFDGEYAGTFSDIHIKNSKGRFTLYVKK